MGSRKQARTASGLVWTPSRFDHVAVSSGPIPASTAASRRS